MSTETAKQRSERLPFIAEDEYSADLICKIDSMIGDEDNWATIKASRVKKIIRGLYPDATDQKRACGAIRTARRIMKNRYYTYRSRTQRKNILKFTDVQVRQQLAESVAREEALVKKLNEVTRELEDATTREQLLIENETMLMETAMSLTKELLALKEPKTCVMVD